MESQNVEDHCGEHRQSEWHEATDQQEQSDYELHRANHIGVTARNEDFDVIAGQARWWRRLGNEMQKEIQSENGKRQAKKQPGNDGEYFHRRSADSSQLWRFRPARFNSITVKRTSRIVLAAMSLLWIGAGAISAETDEPGPFERFFRAMRHAVKESDAKSHSHSSKSKPKSTERTNTATAASTPTATAGPGVHKPPNEANTRAATRAGSKKGDDFRYGIPVPGKKGFVTSPYSPESGYIDVRGFQPGTPVKDPYSDKIILTP